MLVANRGESLLRVKGILQVEDSETPVAIHAVQHVIHAPEHLPDWPDAERGSRIVFITQGLEADAVERSLHAFHRLTRPAARAAG